MGKGDPRTRRGKDLPGLVRQVAPKDRPKKKKKAAKAAKR